MVDPTQQNIPRHPGDEVQRLVDDLQPLTAKSMVMFTTNQTFALLDDMIIEKLESGISWRKLEAWFKRKGFPDLTAVAYKYWRDNHRDE